jgi:hypothetical protein
MSDVARRLLIILGALAVGALFAAGLFVAGRPGGGMLLITDAVLIGLTRIAWPQIRAQGRPLRLMVILAVGIVAVVKLVHG